MKITFLGTGSAYGIPTSGGDWGACNPENEKNKRLCQSILLEKNDVKILFDMGPSFREQSYKHDLKDLDAILFTHAHYDHFAGLPELPNFIKWQTKPISLYAHDETWAGIVKSIFWMFDKSIKIQYYGKHIPDKRSFNYNQPFDIENIEVIPFLQRHGSMNSTGFRVGDFAYTTDLNSMPEKSWDVLRGVKTWVIECDDLKETSDHNNLEQVLRWIKEIQPERAYLTHLSISMDYEETLKKLPKGVYVAWDGLEVFL
jgi:phosphoribosyl 1,2-cyclic phosphate phosphodiesterase